MSSMHFDPTATRACIAQVLRHFIQAPILILVSLLALMPFVLESMYTHTILKLFMVVFLLLFTFDIFHRFIKEKLENDTEEPLSTDNAACLLSYEVLRKLHTRAQTSYELLHAVVHTGRGKCILSEMGLAGDRLLELAKPILEQESIVTFLSEAVDHIDRFQAEKVDADAILFTFFQRGGVFEDILNSLDLSLQDVEMIVRWEQFHHTAWRKESSLSPGNLIRIFGGIGRQWVTGFNDALEAMTVNISDTILYRKHQRKVTIHLDALKDALHILSRSHQHNIIVTGDPGSGKHTFIENIAYQYRVQESKKGFAYTNVLMLKAQELLSGTHDPDAFLLGALKRANRHGHYILVIENIGLFLQASDARIRSVLAKFLQASNISVICIADTQDYHRSIKTDPALDAQFEKITLQETSYTDTMSVLMEEYFNIKDSSRVSVTYKAIKAIVELADRYISKGAFPGKAIDLLHDAVLATGRSKHEYVTEEHIRRMVSLKAHMDVSNADQQERDVLRTLEESMAKHIVGQRPAIRAISNALKRARVDVSTRDRPIGTFLFLGPTGVGKTQTAKVLAASYFGDHDHMIRLDMNEYSTPQSTAAIVGSTDPGAPAEGMLTKSVQDHPFSMILLDEIEKADKKVLNLFLQILDEGQLIDAQGIKTDFRNTIIIATSNAGAAFIADFIAQNPHPDADSFKKTLIDELINEGTYSPEFLNRFDDIILYMPLTPEESVRVAHMMITAITQELEEKKGITVQIHDDAIAAIADKGTSAEFGAREMRRAITDTLETYIADYMLEHEVRRGDVIEIRKRDLKI